MKEFPGHLIVRYLSNQATDLEHEELLQWVSEDVSNQKLFHDFKEAWERGQHKNNRFNAHQALANINTIIQSEKSEARTIKFPWLRFAASLLLLLAASVILWKVSPSEETQLTSYATTDRIDSVLLSDGSLVILNKNSSISFSEKFLASRNVILKGEAFFDVEHDASRPFIIEAGNVKTIVLGTSFNINTDSGATTVTVRSGRVKVLSEKNAAILNASDQAHLINNENQFHLSRVDASTAFGWIDNSFVFEDTPLERAIKAVAHRFGLKANIQSTLTGCLITATFKGASADQILEAFSYSTGIQYTIENRQLIVTGMPCE